MQKIKKVNFFGALLGLCLITGLISNYTHRTGPTIVVVSAVLLLCCLFLAPQLNKLDLKQVRLIVLIAFLIMISLQIIALRDLSVTVYHDPFRVLEQAEQFATGKISWHSNYFFRYTNNVAIAYLLSLWLKLFIPFGVTTNFAIHLLSFLLLDTFIVLCELTVWQIGKKKSLLLASLAFFTLTPFAYSYFLQVFYTDLPGMLILLIVLRNIWFWSQKKTANKVFSGIVLIILSSLAYLIKANYVVIIPALLLVILILTFKKKIRGKYLLTPAILIIVGVALGLPAQKAIYAETNFVPNDQIQFPITHWISMGYNLKEKGSYSSEDVEQNIDLPNKKARQKADQKKLFRRIKKLGFLGVLRLWQLKLGVMLDGRSILNWYNGGLRSAPTWYQINNRFISMLGLCSYAAALVVLFLISTIKMLFWRPKYADRQDMLTLLTIMIALGYLAFHVLLWEAEGRYGQIVIPLLLLVNALLPMPQLKLKKFKLKVRYPKISSTVVALLTVIILCLGVSKLAKKYPREFVVAAQRSQLSAQYNTHPFYLKAHSTLRQHLYLHGPANYLSVQVHPHAKLQVYLHKTHTKQYWLLSHHHGVCHLHYSLSPGIYEFMLVNRTNKRQPVYLPETKRYLLTPYPVRVDSQVKPYASLIFTCLNIYYPKPEE